MFEGCTCALAFLFNHAASSESVASGCAATCARNKASNFSFNVAG